LQTLASKTTLSARLVDKCTTKVVDRVVIFDHALDSSEGFMAIFGGKSD